MREVIKSRGIFKWPMHRNGSNFLISKKYSCLILSRMQSITCSMMNPGSIDFSIPICFISDHKEAQGESNTQPIISSRYLAQFKQKITQNNTYFYLLLLPSNDPTIEIYDCPAILIFESCILGLLIHNDQEICGCPVIALTPQNQKGKHSIPS